ncbi:hypothetical protein R3P38DRAFT_2787951 [Favolaschia claudopus]|uniref:Uncharacterized protein n=1 Tax=Favolaschia claudopus TaxID=2862362 RepID=A0AAW0AL20_9AGAR
MDYQYRLSSNQAEPHLESILEILLEHLVTLLRRLADFQMTSPYSNVSLPHDLSLYFLKPYFVRFKSAVFIACDKWWLCSCLTMELISSHVHSDSTGQILTAMWEVVADQRARFHTFSSPLTPTHPGQCMLEALRQITEHHQTISIIPLVQSAILSHASQSPQFQEFLPEHNEMKTKIPAYPTLAREDPSQDNEEEQTLSILEMRLIILARFISALDSQPYKMQETLSILSQFELPLASICFDPDPWTPIGVSRRQQLGFARSWTAALERESQEGVQATMVEIIVTCPLLQMYWDQSGTGFRWLNDREAAKLLVEGINIAERREDITWISKTRLATIREALRTVVDVHETQVEGEITESAIVTPGVDSGN